MKCKVCKVEFQQPLEEVTDWDDRQRTVQWLSGSQQAEKNKVQVQEFEERACSYSRATMNMLVCLYLGDKDGF